jgi:putative PIN family toxin of toxin-antitoxin system
MRSALPARVVLDTSVLVAAIRSDAGASKALLTAALDSRSQFLLSTPLVLEYEAVLTRREHLRESGLSSSDVGELLDMICATGIQVHMTRSWRPILRDPDDEMVLGTAINGNADAIVTFNRADFLSIPREFDLKVISPWEALKTVGVI